MTATSAGGPLAAYRARVGKGELKVDAAQSAAAARLDALHHALAGLRKGAGGWRERLGLARPAEAPRGLYLYGTVGRGKSLLMDLFFAGAPVAAKRRVHFHAFMLEVHARLHKWRQRAPAEREGKDPIPPLASKLAEEARLLCFDEFQVTNIADAMILGRLFGALFDRGVTVVATSNTAPDDLYRGGLQRERFLPSIELIKSRLDVMELGGSEDYRRGLIRGMRVYHTPLGPEARTALDAAFARLTGDAPGAPEEVVVLGRTVVVPRAAKGVAKMSFAALCETAMGAADYLALAQRFHTLVLDGVRAIGADERDVARRFVNLIDALYENRTKLICAAAAAPEALHPAGDHAAEFRRTASRLNEMQSEAYLAATADAQAALPPLAAPTKSG
jgi:cell division protein ZapE